MTKPKKTYTAIPIERLAATAVLWVWLNVAADTISAAAAGSDLYLMSLSPWGTALGPYGEIPGGGLLVEITQYLRVGLLLVAIISGFLVLKWIYRANRNAHAFATGLQNTPPWAVGWFFVPFACLWKPFQAMSETWRVSHGPQTWKTNLPPDILRLWWGFWLSGNILGNGSFRVYSKATTTTGLGWATALEIASGLCSIVAGVVLVRIILGVSKRQTDLIAARSAVDTVSSPPDGSVGPWGSPSPTDQT